ncbi:hypothetical protein AWC31_35350 [Mycolicibacterium wolinskyi]|uniref:Uncharacterized protein n=1 Tax=Mycolicibacterium wolinskyi TaxID=59750 RepID=A0A1X2F1N4_9MYCO|nr:hypothetical protein AWC31_35350 [Mycolicibacterium wolinskyi]
MFGKPFEGHRQTTTAIDPRSPAELFGRRGDIGAAPLWIVISLRDELDRRLTAGQLTDEFGDLQNRELVRVSDVDGPGTVASGQRQQARDGVVDVAQRPGLPARTVYGDGLPGQSLAAERRHDAAVVGAHARAVCVEYPRDPDVGVSRPLIGERQRLGKSFGFVVHTARADGIDIAPIAFPLWMFQRVAIDFTRRRQHQPRATAFGDLECVRRAERTGAQGLQRQALIVHRRRGRCQVEDRVHGWYLGQRVTDVVLDELVALAVAQQAGGGGGTGRQIVDADHFEALIEHAFAQMTAEEAAAPGYQDTLQFMHEGLPFVVAGSSPGYGLHGLC